MTAIVSGQSYGSPGDVPPGGMSGGERDPADNWGVTGPQPSVADSPYWAEVSGRT